ncbi:protease inhibitor I42 family protein [bacterium]|nr:protease inhibitor I42 family protein [bacterium]
MNIFKQTIGGFLVAGLAICFMGQLGCPNIPSKPTPDDNVKEIKVNESFDITLVSNPTTGYSWEVDFDGEYLTLVNAEYIPEQPELTGSGGVEKFTFTGLKSGTTEIMTNYKRPWEEESIKTEVVKVTIE